MRITEAIENLKYLISDECTDTQNDYIDEICMGIKALEKQLPKKVETFFPLAKAECPSCKGRIEAYASHNNCAWCGQTLDWSDTDAK